MAARAEPVLSLNLRLLLVGLASSGIYLFLLSNWWLWDHFPPDDKGPLAVKGNVIEYGLAVTGLFALYALACWLASRISGKGWSALLVFGFPIGIAGILLLAFPTTSGDIFYYMMSGRIFWEHGDSPFVSLMANYPEDSYLYYVDPFQRLDASPYGPLWTLASGLPALLPQGNPELVLIGYKALSTAAFLATAAVIWLILGELRPQQRLLGVTLFAWNPLLLLMVASNGHNDAVMMFFAVLALYFAIKNRWQLAIPLLIASALVKYVTLLLLPFFLYYAWRQTAAGNRRTFWLGIVAGLGVAVAVFAPLWEGFDTFDSQTNNQRSWFITSFAELAFYTLDRFSSMNIALQAARALAALGFFVLYLLLLLRLRARKDDLVTVSCLALFLYVLFGSTLFYPWYMVWVLSFAACLTTGVWAWSAYLLSFTAVFLELITVVGTQFQFMDGSPAIRSGLAVLVGLAPPATLWAYLAWRHRAWDWRPQHRRLEMAAEVS